MTDSNGGGVKNSDGVKPSERVSPGVKLGRRASDTYLGQAADLAGIIGTKQPALLWALMLVVVVEAAYLWRDQSRGAHTKDLVGQIITLLETTEDNRSEAQQRAQAAIKGLAESIARRKEHEQVSCKN